MQNLQPKFRKKKQKLPSWLSISLLISLIIFCLVPTIPLFLLSNEPKLTDQTLCSMDLSDQSLQPKTDDHPVVHSSASTDLTKTKTKP
uniref:F-ORF n=1 Tax=Pseudocuneopsis sichuanensis TaxID=2856829 RepID=UPI0021CC9B00|nr:F-ORF [Pseudocuneopsis sichuanensis]UWM10793.1 F-ORF [Pseudocuneopsis sichuanensis]